MIAPRVAFSKDFMESYSRLPRPVQKKVREFTEKFQHNPAKAGLKFEKLANVRDEKVRSARIDQAYRVIVIQPPKGDVYLCAWVDHHDEAYRWVHNKRFEVNPTSGSFQLFEMVAPQQVAENQAPMGAGALQPKAEPVAGLLDGFNDEDLLLSGVPEPLLPAVRALKSDDDLDRLAPHLPEDAAEMLYLLAAGYSLLDAIEETERSRQPKAVVDVTDFAAAMASPEAQRTFKVIENEKELDEILDAPLEQWRVFLHPTQRKLVEMHANGPVRVLGSAGAGKTVVLMHRAKHLASKVFTNENDRILVTTFTKNLALDLEANLKNLCGPEFERLEVVHLHRWADQFMRRQEHPLRIATEADRRRLFPLAVSEAESDELPPSFYSEEWEQVVQPQDIDSRDAYLTARRTGRGTRLSRAQRVRVWNVLERYREVLTKEKLVDWQDLVRETRLFIEKQRIPLPYNAVLADEVQDFTANELRLLRTIAPDGPNTLFVVGDGHQRIYGRQTRLGSCGIEIRGRSRRLKLNYRTTEQIRNQAVAVLEGRHIDDLDGGLDTLKGYRSLRSGPVPTVECFAKDADEAAFVVEQLRGWLDAGVRPETVCIAARTNAQIDDRYGPVVRGAGIQYLTVKRNPESEAKKPGVRMATMHRLKGLEFEKLILVGVQEGTMPLDLGEHPDLASQEDHEMQERSLLYVAMTRARDELVISGFGNPSPFVAP